MLQDAQGFQVLLSLLSCHDTKQLFLHIFISGRFLSGLGGARGVSSWWKCWAEGGPVELLVWMALGYSTRHCKGMDFGAFDYALELISLKLGPFISLAWHTLFSGRRGLTQIEFKMNPDFLLKKPTDN